MLFLVILRGFQIEANIGGDTNIISRLHGRKEASFYIFLDCLYFKKSILGSLEALLLFTIFSKM